MSRRLIAACAGMVLLVSSELVAQDCPQQLVHLPGFVGSVAVSGHYAYLAAGWSGVRVIDVSNPAAPVEVGSVESPAYEVEASGGYAYVVAGHHGFRVIDLSDPARPVEVGGIDWPGVDVSYVGVSGRHAYVTWGLDHGDNQRGLSVIDVSAPSAPVEVGSIELPGYPSRVAISGGHAFVVEGDFFSPFGLRVIDISNPAAPVEVGSIALPGEALDVAVSSGYAYVVGDGLRVIDVRDPSAPVEVGWASTGAWGHAVSLSGHFAYVAWGYNQTSQGGLRVIDVSRPLAPVEVGHVDTPGLWAWDVAADGAYAYLTNATTGLRVFRGCGTLWDPRESYIPAAAVAAGAEDAFFQTDVEINNTGSEEAEVVLEWLPRGEDNSQPIASNVIALAPGKSRRYENVLSELVGLEPDSVGALRMVASTESVIGMSRTYNIPGGKATGTFGQGLPAIRTTQMIAGTEPRRILFLSENDHFRANVGCVNGTADTLRINIGIFDDEGTFLEAKTMDLGPWSNNQINRLFRDWEPVNGYVDVWADRNDALYYCYGSLLDNLTSDPTTILPQAPSDEPTFIPAAAFAAGLEGSFFSTDVDLNNAGPYWVDYAFYWLPRGEDNSHSTHSDVFTLAPDASVRHRNVLESIFGLEPNAVGALGFQPFASDGGLLAVSRTYSLPSATQGGTFGQELPGIPADRMIPTGVKKRILFMNESADLRSNVGCQNGSQQTVRVFIELFNSEGESLEVRIMDLAPYSNNQITRVFRDHAPISAGYVDVWTTTTGASIACYGSMLDNLTNDPTTVLPQ